MVIELSEWGKKYAEFNTIEEAAEYYKNNVEDDEGIIWIVGDSRKEMDAFRVKNKEKINHEFMRLKYKGKVNWVWCSIDKNWKDLDADIQEARNYREELIKRFEPKKETMLERFVLRFIKKRAFNNRSFRLKIYRALLSHFEDTYYEDNKFTCIYNTSNEYFEAMLSSLEIKTRGDVESVNMLKRGLMNEFNETRDNKHFKVL